MNSAPVIVATDLAAAYPRHKSGGGFVWSGANFSIGAGEFVAVLGPNGAGKTTLFKLLLGLVKPVQGELLLFDESPRRGSSKIGYVPQRHEVDPETRIEVLEIVRLGACDARFGFDMPKAAKEERAKALEALESVGGEELAHRPIGELSGGEQQRVFLAQALAGNPKILLLDEPLSNLDIRREGELVQLIEKIVQERNVTVLLIAHNINPLLGALDRVMYIANGKIATGEPRDVLNSESLSRLYDAPIEVLRDSRGRLAIIGAEEGTHHHQ